MDKLIKNNQFDIIAPYKMKKYASNNNVNIGLGRFDNVYNESKTYEIYKKPQQMKIKRKITAPPYSFQIDITIFKPYKNKQYVFSLIDIESRFAFMYILKNKTLLEIIDKFKIFINENKEQNININSIT